MRTALGSEMEFQGVDENYFKVLRIAALFCFGICALLLAAVGFFFRESAAVLCVVCALLLALLCVTAALLAVARRRARAVGYLLGADELLVRKGIMFRRLVVVPYGRMQTVNVESGPVLGHYGLAEIKFVTASADADISIPGIRLHDAQNLRKELTRLGNAKMEGL